MSGTGKSTLLEVLAKRGHLTVDTDYDGWTLADGRWDATRMSKLLDREPDVVVAGTVDNQGDFYDRFDHIVLRVRETSESIQVAATEVANGNLDLSGRTPALVGVGIRVVEYDEALDFGVDLVQGFECAVICRSGELIPRDLIERLLGDPELERIFLRPGEGPLSRRLAGTGFLGPPPSSRLR